ncbi:MAG: putative toxin-antitoxin system toxin component, PIN family [Lachnospiraceae bacterium]|nr:putative toxin-antitoxin system toxin component, PIN family [Lachnospiraceae bacterium]MDE7258678.1 putative toxin-antitoxin system toxin component, PIN family [Lachnospiraceae bacterium]
MRIVIDTNVLISGVFFGGFPRKVLSSVVTGEITAYATAEIINEYEAIVQEMIDRKQGHINKNILTPLITAMEIIEPITQIEICRDPDDNKFLGCAKDSHSLYIVSGDKDLLVIEKYENIQIITAKEFCEKYISG